MRWGLVSLLMTGVTVWCLPSAASACDILTALGPAEFELLRLQSDPPTPPSAHAATRSVWFSCRIRSAIVWLVISVFADERTVLSCVKSGASGYLLKDGTADQIAAAVLELVDGGSPLSPSVARYVLRLAQSTAEDVSPALSKHGRLGRSARTAAPALTEREIAVLELLAKGFSPTVICEMLDISRHTVITHSRNIHRKLEVSSRSEAI